MLVTALAAGAATVALWPRHEPVDDRRVRTNTSEAAATVTPVTPIPKTYSDGSYGPTPIAPTKDKPQSKLWFNDGSWWALMISASDERVRIHELERDHTWRDTGVVVDERAQSTADALWDGNQLLIASRTGTGEIRLLRFSYDGANRTYRLLPGFPLVLATGGAPSVAIAKDSTGRVWATFIQHGTVYITHTDPLITHAEPPTPIPAAVTTATDDDVSCVVSVGRSIAVMWSDQSSGAFRFVIRRDVDPETVWQPMEVPLHGDHMADGHVNLVALEDGRLLAAVKTSLDEAAAGAERDAPLIEVLQRTPDGQWTSSVAGNVGDRMTRPVLLVDPGAGLLLLLTTSPETGGTVYYKASALDTIGFNLGMGVPFVTAFGATVNNPTVLKGSLPSGVPIVVLAADDHTHRYYHAELSAR